MGTVLRWMVSEPGLTEGKAVWLESRRLSADEISAQADLRLLYAQRESFCKGNWEVLARNHAKSVFYQLDLMDVAGEFHKFGIDKPEVLPTDASLMQRIHNRMLRAQIEKLDGRDFKADEQAAFNLLREGLLTDLYERKSSPRPNVYSDQIV